jgi:membrane-bound lytic murein transglycosylase F
LLAAINKFVKNYYRGKTYNVLRERYFEKPIVSSNNSLLAQLDRLSPYDEIVRKYAEQYSFDWRLIVAQMYQESQFDPKAVSYAGAEGLMQILPATGEYLGTSDLENPKSSIKAGVKYLGMLRDRFEDDLLLEDRIWLSLAAYNAGYNRVKRARYLTEEMGLDKDRWFGHVEKAMLALAQPYKMSGKTRRHCRCGQTVIYVRNIRTLYNNYVRLTQATQLASSKTSRQFPYDI